MNEVSSAARPDALSTNEVGSDSSPWRVHQRAVFIVDDTRTVRFVTTTAADSPDDIGLGPINDVIHEIRGQSA